MDQVFWLESQIYFWFQCLFNQRRTQRKADIRPVQEENYNKFYFV